MKSALLGLLFISFSGFSMPLEKFQSLCPDIQIDLKEIGDIIVLQKNKCVVEVLTSSESALGQMMRNQETVFNEYGSGEYYGIGFFSKYKTNAPELLRLQKENLKSLKLLWMYFELKSADGYVFEKRPISVITEMDKRELKRRHYVEVQDSCYSCHEFDFRTIKADAKLISKNEFVGSFDGDFLLEENFSDPDDLQVVLDVWGQETLNNLMTARLSNDSLIKATKSELTSVFRSERVYSYAINDVDNENTWQGFYIYQEGYNIVLKSFIWNL